MERLSTERARLKEVADAAVSETRVTQQALAKVEKELVRYRSSPLPRRCRTAPSAPDQRS